MIPEPGMSQVRKVMKVRKKSLKKVGQQSQGKWLQSQESQGKSGKMLAKSE